MKRFALAKLKKWKENKNIPVENEIGNKIWDKIENQCIKVHKRIVPLELIQ